ncbi:hypothetical protein [uncultured Ruminobacter sp.]|uniref:hypothetical protein n=1 Tax=uncultured Ruminobacter sp. TaxID=538947 RepID=UPI00260D7C8D|nr:hypothetical protein [uncultured Ruminobacter sp.]
MGSENKSGLPEPLPDAENSEVNGGICENRDGSGNDNDIPPIKTKLLMLLVRVPLLLLAVWLILQIFPILFIPNESGISNKPGESCGAICFFSDTFYGFAVPVVKCIALLLLGAVLILIFLWCVTENKKDILLMFLLVAGILILPFIVIIMLLVLL